MPAATTNPTPLLVGMKGMLGGRNVRVVGRVVLGMDDGGETYYWNEFNVVDDGGRSATLVFEETDAGAEWKLFRRFEPLRVLTATEAAQKREGDKVDLDGTPRPVTLVDQSRVYHIEGTGPEGVEVGDVADYFNVDTGEHMLVASWTGDEIEFYEGWDVAEEDVAKGFGFPLPNAASSPFHTDDSERAAGFEISPQRILKVVFIVGIIAFIFWPSRSPPASSPAVKQSAPAPRLVTGAAGGLEGTHFTIASHATVGIARVGSRYDRHEYELQGDQGERALLIQGLNGNPKEWHLLVAQPSPAKLGPYEAAALRKDASVMGGDPAMRINTLFQSRRLSLDGRVEAAVWPAAIQYGFVATNGTKWLMARWTEAGIQFHAGKRLPETAVLAALGPGPERGR